MPLASATSDYEPHRSNLNLNPDVALYLNEIVSLLMITASTLMYKMNYDGSHDMFQWVVHMTVWGQNQLFWLLQLIINNERSREFYFKSTFLTALVPYLGVPVYMIWSIAFFFSDREQKYSVTYFAVTQIGWLFYFIIIRWYTHEILSALYNLWQE